MPSLNSVLRQSVLALGIALTSLSAAAAKPFEVGGEIGGSPGHWTVRLWLKNDIRHGPSDMAVKIFGLSLPAGSSLDALPGFDADLYHNQWEHGGAGGPQGVEFNHSWAASSDRIVPNQWRNGFTAHIRQQQLPENLPWFVLARSPGGGHYQGNDHFGLPVEPGFAGVLTLRAVEVPEPGSTALLGLGLLGIAWWRRLQPTPVARAAAKARA